MGQKRSTAGSQDSNQHQWIAGATLTVTPREARFALLRGYVAVGPQTRVDVYDVYCGGCRRPYDEVADKKCTAVETKDREHLHGGPIGERKKRDGADTNLLTVAELPRRASAS